MNDTTAARNWLVAGLRQRLDWTMEENDEDSTSTIANIGGDIALDTLALPENRTALLSWLADVVPAEDRVAHLIAEGAAGVMLDALTANGNLVPADVWDAPEVTDEQVQAADDELAGWLQTLNESEGDATVADECEHWREIANDLHAARDRVTVYYEDEDRPDGAVPLFRVVREAKP